MKRTLLATKGNSSSWLTTKYVLVLPARTCNKTHTAMSLYQHPKGLGKFDQFFRKGSREANICDMNGSDLTGEASDSSARVRARKILTCTSSEIDLIFVTS
jgi:hypothetical protein